MTRLIFFGPARSDSCSCDMCVLASDPRACPGVMYRRRRLPVPTSSWWQAVDMHSQTKPPPGTTSPPLTRPSHPISPGRVPSALKRGDFECSWIEPGNVWGIVSSRCNHASARVSQCSSILQVHAGARPGTLLTFAARGSSGASVVSGAFAWRRLFHALGRRDGHDHFVRQRRRVHSKGAARPRPPTSMGEGSPKPRVNLTARRATIFPRQSQQVRRYTQL